MAIEMSNIFMKRLAGELVDVGFDNRVRNEPALNVIMNVKPKVGQQLRKPEYNKGDSDHE